MSKVNIVLDASMLDMLQLCEARFDMRYNQNKDTLTKSKALDRGAIVHTGNEAYYRALANGERFETAVDKMLIAAKVAISESDLQFEDNTPKRILEVLEEHATYWRVEDQRLEILAVETPFAYVLFENDEVRIIMIGKIDLTVNDYPNYKNLPYDHKSYDREYPVKRLTNQFQNYAVAARSNYLMVNKIGFQTSLKPHEKYRRTMLSYDPLILQQWKDNTISWILNRYLPCVASNSWPMNFTSCDKFNRTCEYFEVCDSSGIESKVYKLNANFRTVEPWDVSKSLGLDKEKV